VSLALPPRLPVVKLEPRLEATVPRSEALLILVLPKARLASQPQEVRAAWALPWAEALPER
jgi:hypothetical protein